MPENVTFSSSFLTIKSINKLRGRYIESQNKIYL